MNRNYILKAETLGITYKGEHATMVMLPKDAKITIAKDQVDRRMIDVTWDGQLVKIFTQDLDDRGIIEDGHRTAKDSA